MQNEYTIRGHKYVILLKTLRETVMEKVRISVGCMIKLIIIA
jgi:hypothetical protein